MKKLMCTLLAACMSVGMAVPAFADSTDSKTVENLILTAKEKVAIDDSVLEFRNYYSNEANGKTQYTLNWENKDKDVALGQSVSVTIDTDGVISRYSSYDDSRSGNQMKFPEKDQEAAINAAKEFSTRMNSARAGQTGNVQASYYNYENTYSVSMERQHNGIPVGNDGIHVELDADTLKVYSYNANWTDGLKFEDGKTIDADAAKAAYQEKLGYELFYQVASEDYADTVKLVYRPKYNENAYIDAATGEAVTYEEYYRAMNAAAQESSAKDSMSGGGGASLSEVEAALVDEVSKMLSKEQAEKIARDIKEFNISSAFQLKDYNVYKDQSGRYLVRLGFRTEGEEVKYKSVSINAKTGEVVSYYGSDYVISYRETSAQKATVTAEETKKIAEDFLKAHYADKFAKTEPASVLEPQAQSVSYKRVENGVKVFNNGFTVAVDEKTKEISSFSLDWTDVSFPAADSAKEPADVYAKVLTEDNFALRYVLVPKKDSDPVVFDSKLVYAVEQDFTFDAETLEQLDYRLKPVVDAEKPQYTDIAGHYAEDCVNKLLTLDIYFSGNELRPNEAVTQKDFLTLLAKAVYQRSINENDADFYRFFIRQGIIAQDDIRPTETITRIEGITYLLNAMGYKEFANIRGIFNCPFTDIPENSIGYASIAAGLHLVSAESDAFYADSPLKRADSLIILYNYLTR